MNDDSIHSCPQRWFLSGMVLAGISSIPFMILFFNFFNAFRAISQEKATGLAAVAGGPTEAYVTFGLILSFMLPVAAIVMLFRSFSAGNEARKLFSMLSICWSALMLALYGLGAWLLLVQLPRLVSVPR